MKIKEFYKNHKKKILTTAIAIPTIFGTYSGTEKGLTPLYNKKIGKSYGINIGIITKYLPGSEHNGLSISAIHVQKGGTINGGLFSLITIEIPQEFKDTNNFLKPNIIMVNGLEFSLANIVNDFGQSFKVVNGFQGAVVSNKALEVNGFQGSFLYNKAERNSGMQAGLVNLNNITNNLLQVGGYSVLDNYINTRKKGILINYKFKGKNRK